MAAFIETDLRKLEMEDFLLRMILALGESEDDDEGGENVVVCLCCFIPAAARMSLSISASLAELRSTRSASETEDTFSLRGYVPARMTHPPFPVSFPFCVTDQTLLQYQMTFSRYDD